MLSLSLSLKPTMEEAAIPLFYYENKPETSRAFQMIRRGEYQLFVDSIPNPEDLYMSPRRAPFSLCDSLLHAKLEGEISRQIQEEFPVVSLPLVSLRQRVKECKEKRPLSDRQKGVLRTAEAWMAASRGSPFEHRFDETLSFEYSTFGYVMKNLKMAASAKDENRLAYEESLMAFKHLIREMKRVSRLFPQGIEKEVREFFACASTKRCNRCSNCCEFMKVIQMIRARNDRPSNKQFFQMLRCSFSESSFVVK